MTRQEVIDDVCAIMSTRTLNPQTGDKIILGLFTNPVAEKICYVWDGEKWVKASGDDCK